MSEESAESEFAPTKLVWSNSLDCLLKEWKKQITSRLTIHNKLARKFSKRNYILGVPVIILTAITATGILATFEDCDCSNKNSTRCDVVPWVRVVTGILAILSASLSGIQTFVNYQKKSEENKTAFNGYSRLKRKIEVTLGLPYASREDAVFTLREIRKEYDLVADAAPTVPHDTQNNELCNLPKEKIEKVISTVGEIDQGQISDAKLLIRSGSEVHVTVGDNSDDSENV